MNEQLKLDNQLCFRLYTTARLVIQSYEPLFKPLGITYTQYLVLLVLWEKDEQLVTEISNRLLLGVDTTSPLIKRMEKNGILARRDSKTDKRQQIVFLTEKGNRMKTQAAEIPNCMVANLQSCALDFQKLDP